MAVLYPFSPALADLLSRPPEVGRNRHHWLFRVAAKLKAADWKPEKIAEGLKAICDDRGWSDRSGKTVADIVAKLENAPAPVAVDQLSLHADHFVFAGGVCRWSGQADG